MIQSCFDRWTLHNASVLVRVDWNVPIADGVILDDFKLERSLPTLNALRARGARLVLITHMGRPNGFDASLSTQQLIAWFNQRGYSMVFAGTLEKAQQLLKQDATMVLLENIRFWPQEREHNAAFAQQLATLGQFCVVDAFASLHDTDTSITLLPRLFCPDRLSCGLLVSEELRALEHITNHPARPFIAIIGGGKIDTKHNLIQAMALHADRVFIGPALCFSLMGSSSDTTQMSMELNRTHDESLVVPQDFIVAHGSLGGPLERDPVTIIGSDQIGVTIGPRTVHAWSKEIYAAKTVLYSGLMGDVRYPRTLSGVHALYTAMTQTQAYTLIAGGDSVAAARALGIADRVSYCSTGGGASLSYICGKALPGLNALAC